MTRHKFPKKRAHTPEDEDSAQEQALKPSKKAKGEKSGKTAEAEGPFWEVCVTLLSILCAAMMLSSTLVQTLTRIPSSCHPSVASTSQSSTTLF